MTGGVQQGRQQLAFEHHLVVHAPLDHTRHIQGGPGVGGLAGAQQTGVQLAQLHGGTAFASGVRVGNLGLQHAVAHQVVIAFCVAFSGAGAAQRQCQHDGVIAHRGANVQWLGQRIDAGHIERCAIAKHTHRAQQSELAQGQRGLVDLDLGKTPGIATGAAQQVVAAVIGVALTLLQMLRLEQHALAPDHLGSPTHSRSIGRHVCAKTKPTVSGGGARWQISRMA